MALKIKKPRGRGNSRRVLEKKTLRAIQNNLQKQGLILKSGSTLRNLRVKTMPKGPTVGTPRRTSRGISF